MAKPTVANSGRGQGFKGTGNLLQDLLSSTVSINKLESSSLLNHKPLCSTVLEDENENKGLTLTLFTSSCSVCFSDSERVEVIKEAEVDILKKVVFKSWTNVTPPPPGGLGFNWICTHCSATLGRLAKCRQEIEDIVTCLQSVIRIQIATGQRANLIHESNGAVRDVPRLSMTTTARVPLAKNEASNPKCAPPSEYNAQESVGLDNNVLENILKAEGDTDNREGINTSHVEDGNESEDKSIWVPIHVKAVPKLGEDPLDLTNWQVIQNLESTGASQLEQDPLDLAHWQVIDQVPLLITSSLVNEEKVTVINTDIDKPAKWRVACACPNCSDPKNNGQPKNKHLCHIHGCGKVYFKTAELRDHLYRHIGEKPFGCQWPLCGKRFTRSCELSRHRRSHTGDKRFQCFKCHKTFARTDHLSKHIRTHFKNKKFMAADGSQRNSFIDFVDEDGDLNGGVNMDITNEHRSENVDTNFAYSDRKMLRNRLRWHAGEKPFVCQFPLCGKRFARKDFLSKHMGRHSNNICFTAEKRLQCPDCPIKFTRRDALFKHIESHSNITGAKSEDGSQPPSFVDVNADNEEDLKPVLLNMEIDIMDEGNLESVTVTNPYNEVAHMES